MTDNTRGALFMTLAMAAFALEDMALKSAARQIPMGQALSLFGLCGFVIYAMQARSNGEAVLHAAIRSRTMRLRCLSEISGRVFYALAIALTPLSSASAILQAAPLVVALGAVALFGETITLRRWVAILGGFAGVLLILRPGIDGFEPASIFAVLGMLGFAGRDLATRASPPSMSTAQLGVLGFAMVSIAGLILMVAERKLVWPDAHSWLMVALASGVGVLAYSALTRAMRLGEVSVVTPFRYTRLLFGIALGILVFGERPDLFTLFGGLIIVASGLLLMARRRPRPT